MTHHEIKVLEDGTRVYSNHTRYKPLPLEKRKYKVRKPEDPRAVLYHGVWFLPLSVLTDDMRSMPETRPDTDAYEHAGKRRRCRCNVCHRPTALKWENKWRKEQGLKPLRPRKFRNRTGSNPRVSGTTAESTSDPDRKQPE